MHVNEIAETFCRSKPGPISKYEESPLSIWEIYGYEKDEFGNDVVYLCYCCNQRRKYRRLRVMRRLAGRSFFKCEGEDIYLDLFK